MRKGNLLFGLSAIVLLSFTAATLAQSQGTSEKALRVNGAAMASNLVQKWAEAYMKANPQVAVIVTGSSAGQGFRDLLNNTADIALTTRLILPSEERDAAEKGMKLAHLQVGYAGMAIFTSRKNPLSSLTMDQLKKVFTGEIASWKEVGGPDLPIRRLTRKIPDSGGAVFFWEKVVEKEPFAKDTVMCESFSTILKVCATAQDIPIGIGPVPVNGNNSGAKMLAISREAGSPPISPGESTLANKSYPIILPFYLYWNSQTQDARVKPFVDYCVQVGLGEK